MNPDEEQLRFATAHGRAVITANNRDFSRLHRDWAKAGRNHAGILITTHQSAQPESVARVVLELQQARSSRDMISAILFIGRLSP